MAAKKVGELIKEARTAAGMTQEALARKVDGLSAADISKTERGEMVPTQEQLKAIAKATGVTQKSLLEAPKPKTAAAKTSSGKTSSSKKTDNTESLTTAEKHFLKLYRAASTKDRELAKMVLEGKTESAEFLLQVLGNKVTGQSSSSAASSLASAVSGNDMSDMIGSLLGNVLGKK